MSRALKIFLSLVAIILVGTIGYFVYLRFVAPAPVTPKNPPVQTVGSGPEAVAPPLAILKQFTTQSALAFWMNQKTNAVYYSTPLGKILKTFGDGRDEEVSAQTLADLHRITASPDGTRAIASFNYPLRETFAVFDTATDSWERLPEDVVAAAFDPGSQKIAYLKNSATNPGLYIVTLGDRKTMQALSLAVADGELWWNTPNELVLVPRPSSSISSEVWVINIAKKTLRMLSDRTASMYVLFTNDSGLKLVPRNRFDSHLDLTDGIGNTLQTLPFLTLPSKCAVNAKTFYCAVPESFPLRAELPEDYFKQKFFTKDTFLSYNVETGTTTILPALTTPVDADQLVVQDGKILFRNRLDEKVYEFEFEPHKKTEE